MKTLTATTLSAAILPAMFVSPLLGPLQPFGSGPDGWMLLPGSSSPSAIVAQRPSTDAPQATAAQWLGTEKAINEDLRCLALNIYHEARSESRKGQIAVARVTLNRVESQAFPDSVCAVVKQGGEKRHQCQFSWWCDGKSDRPVDSRAWRRSLEIGRQALANKAADPTEGALFYHADYVKPQWSKVFDRTARIGRHLFYRPSRKG